MDAKTIAKHREQYAAELEIARHRVTALKKLIDGLDELESGGLALELPEPPKREPLKLTPGVIEVMHKAGAHGASRSDIRTALKGLGYNIDADGFGLRLGKVLQRQLDQGTIRSEEGNNGKLVFFIK